MNLRLRLHAHLATLLGTVSVLVAALATAGPAFAQVSITNFSVTPSTTQAGGAPDLTVDASFSVPAFDWDSPENVSIALPAGLLADPAGVPQCSATDFGQNKCPSGSWLGGGTVTGTTYFCWYCSLPVNAYLVAPQGGEPARVGAIITAFGFDLDSVTAPVEIRTTPDVGGNLALLGLPDQYDGIALMLNAVHFTVRGSVGGKAFTRNPTSCAPATTTVTMTSHQEPGNPITATSSFTPTGCQQLSYAPQVSAAATLDAGDNGVAITATLTQNPSDAATRDATLTLPSQLAPRITALANPCTATDLATCPAIGSATVVTPLLSTPLQATLVLVAHPGSLPTIDAIAPPPFALTLQATPMLTAGGLAASFTNLPDMPLSSLSVSFAGGPNSVLVAGKGICATPQQIVGDLTAQNGATQHLLSTVALSGPCPQSPGGGGTGGGTTGTGGGTTGTAAGVTAGTGTYAGATPASTAPVHPAPPARTARPTGSLTFAGLAGRSPTLRLTITAPAGAPGLTRVTVRMPAGLSIATRSLARWLSLKVDGHALARAASIHAGSLVVALGSGRGRQATIALTGQALRVARAIVTAIRHHRAGRLALSVIITDSSGRVTTLRLVARAR